MQIETKLNNIKNIEMKKICLTIVILMVASVVVHAAIIKSYNNGGLWDEKKTWEGGVVPNASDEVIISTGSTVTIEKLTICSGIEISGILNFTAGGLVVNGNLKINSDGSFRPWAGGGVSVGINGNFINNGNAELSRIGTVIRMGTPLTLLPTIISGKGNFTKGVVRTLRIDNTEGVTLEIPLNIAAELALWRGEFNANGIITLDNSVNGNGKPTEYVKLVKKKGSLVGEYKLGAKGSLKEE